MKNIIYKILSYGCIAGLLLSGCKKQDAFLDTKPNIALAVPSTLQDLQLLLQDDNVFNALSFPALGELSTDDYYTTDALWATSTSTERNSYVWAKQIYDAGQNVNDWSYSYTQVYYANTILDDLPKINYTSNQQSLYNEIKGSALFFRAMAFYGLVDNFTLPYNSATAGTDLGIPLRLSSDINTKYPRASLQASYNQILQDLQTCLTLLPAKPSLITLPSKGAAYGLLSRVYLVLGNYNQSLKNADSCLSINNTLQDFNNLTPGNLVPYPNYSPEDIFHGSLSGYYIIHRTAHVDSNLYKLFNDPNDLRPGVFFHYYSTGQIGFLSQFDKNGNTYCGISTDEIYLNKAECEARLGDLTNAMADLNALLVTRWKTGTFVPYNAATADDALIQILIERRKELVMTGLRWGDLRRLNKDVRFAVTLTRVVNGITYTLPPNDPRYAMPIPDPEIQLSGIQQNQR